MVVKSKFHSLRIPKLFIDISLYCTFIQNIVNDAAYDSQKKDLAPRE